MQILFSKYTIKVQKLKVKCRTQMGLSIPTFHFIDEETKAQRIEVIHPNKNK
jgi:hypothetical protein